jgi:HEAT repeat protein
MGRARDVSGLIRELSNDLETDAYTVRAAPLRYLAKIGDARAARRIEELLRDDPRADVRVIAAWALGEIGDAGSTEALLSSLKSRHSPLQTQAAQSLGKIRDRRAVAPLSACLESSDERLRKVASEALARIGGGDAQMALRQAIDGKNFRERRRLKRALRDAAR